MITELHARFTSPKTAIVAGEVLGTDGWITVMATYAEADGRWVCEDTADKREHQSACDAEFLALLERCAMLAAEAQGDEQREGVRL